MMDWHKITTEIPSINTAIAHSKSLLFPFKPLFPFDKRTFIWLITQYHIK